MRAKNVVDLQGNPYGIRFQCPGCGDSHVVPTVGANSWGYNGSLVAPTLTPSLLVRWRGCDPDDPDVKIFETVCHSFITDGRIQFLGDCTHALAGQTVDLPELEEK